MAALFVKHPSFPQANSFFTASNFFWKMRVREWAFAQVNVTDVDVGLEVTSNNPNVVLGKDEASEKGLKQTRSPGTKNVTVKFYAMDPGFTFVHLIGPDVKVQVEVMTRRAPSEAAISLTKLEGKTVVINAPDAKAYTMDTSLTFNTKAGSAGSFFDGVPSGVNHVVVSSHGGVLTDADKADANKLCMFVSGFDLTSFRLDVGNAEEAFKALKGKVAKDCVIWLGGCTIGANDKFCSTAAKASGCPVVAVVMALVAKPFPKGNVDMLDRVAVPKVFGTDGKLMAVKDFCAKQEKHKFVVPV